MAGSHRANLTLLCLVPFVCGADGLLTRRVHGACSNSDGVAGYNFSHKGLWIPGYELAGTGFSKLSCSETCSKQSSCVAFSGAFKEDGGNGGCYTYKATGGNVPSGTDRAYKKCVNPVDVIAGATSMHLVEQQTMTEAQLVLMAKELEDQLDGVTKTMGEADLRIRKLKSMVAGTAQMLTDASRKASVTAQMALNNRGGLNAIARAKEHINMTFGLLETTNASASNFLRKISARAPKPGQPAGPSLSALAPNVTDIEEKINKMNDPKTLAEVDTLLKDYTNFTDKIGATVKTVLRTHFRELVDTQREALYNYTTALQNHKVDPCCTGDCGEKKK